MFKFRCFSCNEGFNIAFENLYNKIAIQCPNCNNQLPLKAVTSLRQFSESYMDFIDVLYRTNTHDRGWCVSIKETESSIPEQPDAYFHEKRSEEDSFWEHRRKPFKPKDIDDSDLPF